MRIKRMKSIRMMVAGVLSVICTVTSLYPMNIQAKVQEVKVESYKIDEYVHNEILVQISNNCSEESKNQLFHDAGVEIDKVADDCYVVKPVSNRKLEKAISYLESSDKVELVQPNFCYQTEQMLYDGIFVQDDINYSQNQWALKNSGSLEFNDNFRFNGKNHTETVKEVAGIDGNIMPLWEEIKGKTGKEVIVAVIDSGIDIGHQAMQGKLWKNTKEIPGDRIDNDHNGYVDDYDGWNTYSFTKNLKDELGHGTHCAGIIAANGVDNVWGVTGKANVRIMPVKVFNDMENDDESSLGATSFSIRCGIKYAEKNGADICNLSLGMSRNDTLLEETIEKSNMLFVCAAGNDGSNIVYSPCYPGSYTYDNVITVGNIRCDGSLHVSSNYDNELVPVVAPGTQIYSTLPDGKYDFMSGTSMATPYVAGIAAMLYSYYPRISAGCAKKQICRNARELPGLEGYIGYGLVDAYGAYISDVTEPSLKRKTTIYKSKGYATIKLQVFDEGLAGVSKVCWAEGRRSKAYFAYGEGGKSVQPNGTITVKKSGYYSLYAIDNKGNESWTVTKITIPVPTSVRVKKSSVTIKRGKTYTLKPTVSPSGVYASYTFSSGNTSIATVDKNGKITAKKRGTVVITIRTRNGKRCTCKVTVQ
ncbi:MAG: S8 family serine peptidase [Clostridium sp.]|nr:S8 family serine peptidase [Clostridium sp.]